MTAMAPPNDDEARARGRALGSARALAAGGAVLLLSSLVIGDERWRGVALIVGALLAGVGVLTLAWHSVEASVPWGRRD